MTASAAPSSSGSTSHRTSVSPATFPLEEPVSDPEEAIQKLQECPPPELRRACKHHRRALEALREGAYDALSERTRDQLIERFHTNLEALNAALSAIDEEDSREDVDASGAPVSEASTHPASQPEARGGSGWI